MPSLIALTWFQPLLAVTTIAESLVLLYASQAAMALPLLKRRNLEGPRKLALVFTVGFVLKLALGWTLALWFPKIRLTELFGFGYVLTSLIAVKMLNLKKTGRVLLPSIAVSLVGYVAASAIGLGLEQLAPRVTAGAATGPDRCRHVGPVAAHARRRVGARDRARTRRARFARGQRRSSRALRVRRVVGTDRRLAAYRLPSRCPTSLRRARDVELGLAFVRSVPEQHAHGRGR